MNQIVDGQYLLADDLMNMYGLLFKNYTAVLWNTAYNEGGDTSSWNAKLHSDGNPQFLRMYNNTFQTNTAYEKSNLIYDSTNFYYYTIPITSANLIYIDIYATSVNESTLTSSTNKIYCVKLDTNLWRVYSSNASVNQARNGLFTILFYGLGAGVTTPNGVTGLTELRISDVVLQDTIIRYIEYTGSPGVSTAWDNTITINTSSNYFITSDYYYASVNSGYQLTTELFAPTGTSRDKVIINPGGGSGNNTKDNRYTSSFYQISSNTTIMQQIHFLSAYGSCSGIQRCVYGRPSGTTVSNVITGGTQVTSGDITISNNAPDIVNYPVETSYLILQNTTPITITNSITCWGTNIDTSTTLTESNSADGTNYISVQDSQITRYTNVGTDLRRKITLVRTDLTKVDKITEEVTIYNWY